MPVEDEEGKVAGLISCFEALRQCAPAPEAAAVPVPVSAVMQPDPVTIAPEATVSECGGPDAAAKERLPAGGQGRTAGGDRDGKRYPPAHGTAVGAARRGVPRRMAAELPASGHLFPRLLGSYGETPPDRS